MALATTVFAVVDGVLFKPLPYPRVNEIFGLSPDVAAAGGTIPSLRSVSPAHLHAWREAVPDAVFSAFNTSGSELTLGGETVELALVDARFLDVLGQRPLIGGFRAEHFGPRGPVRAALITYGLWQRAFGGDPAVVGRIFPNESADGRPLSSTEVVGILPRDFLFPVAERSVQARRSWSPCRLAGQPAQESLGLSLRVLARIPLSMPRADVERRLCDATREVAKRYPLARPGSPSPARTTWCTSSRFDRR